MKKDRLDTPSGGIGSIMLRIPRKDVQDTIQLELDWIESQMLQTVPNTLEYKKLKNQQGRANKRMKLQLELEEKLKANNT